MSSQPTSAHAPERPARASATLILVREGPAGPEVLLLQRAERGDQSSGSWVFPGGLVDPADRTAHSLSPQLGDNEASARLGLAVGGLDYLVAAIRECFEEAGVLLAHDAQGEWVSPPEEAQAWRGQLQRGERSLLALCEAQGWWLATQRLAYISHWITPHGLPKRYDTRFFLTQMPAGQAVSPDGQEVVAHRWISPALATTGQAGLKLMGPTSAVLRELARFEDLASLLAWAESQEEVACIRPRLARLGGQSVGPVQPSHPAWPELGRIDPWGQGIGANVIEPARAVALSPGLLRVSADNGSMMTGPGTNTYLLRSGPDNRWAVIDPGPDDERHVQAVLAAAPGPIAWILVTHTHTDHSPAAARLKALSGAQLYGRLPLHPQWQDTGFAPDVLLQGGERLALGPEATLEVIHTPGHASNHLCYLLMQERMLFTGDHVMQGSTVVINPPDGVMAEYLASLQHLAEQAARYDWIAPGHGFLIAQPRLALHSLLQHRLRREARVVQALQAAGPSGAEALLPRVYEDVHPARHGVALRSLQAHLLHLQGQGLAQERQGVWALLKPQ